MSGGHTPGPWLVNPVSARIDVPYQDAPICQMLWPTGLRGEDETFANARLISAAPELLEALIVAVEHFGPFAEITVNGRLDPDDVRITAMMRAAIAKATGA